MRPEKQTKKLSNQDKEVDVLYQKLGDRWYAFSMIDGEVFFGTVDSLHEDTEANSKKSPSVKTFKKSGQS